MLSGFIKKNLRFIRNSSRRCSQLANFQVIIKRQNSEIEQLNKKIDILQSQNLNNLNLINQLKQKVNQLKIENKKVNEDLLKSRKSSKCKCSKSNKKK